MKRICIFLIFTCSTLSSCSMKAERSELVDNLFDIENEDIPIDFGPEDIKIEKKFLYDQHTLADSYPYKKTTREFQWDKIRKRLFILDSIQTRRTSWGILQNYKNKNGKAPLVKNPSKNEYKHFTDSFGIEQYQAIPLFLINDSTIVNRYAKDGSLVKYIGKVGTFVKIATLSFKDEWLVPQKYIKAINDTVVFKKAIFVDRTNQNITTLEKVDSIWFVRSMNPATTGLYKPPYKYKTPVGIFVIQNKMRKMVYLADGSHDEIGGFSPYASRFSNGGYLHGIPIDEPRTKEVEFSSSLGTTPRSHMCVRNATSHAKFIYDWAAVEQTAVFIFD